MTVREQIVSIALQQVGKQEAADHKNDGAFVKMLLNYVGLPEGYAWCAALVSWVYGQVPGIVHPKLAMANAWFPPKHIIWQQNGTQKEPQPGDVIGYYHKELGRIAHVGIYIRREGNIFYVLEGNTNDNGSREGYEVLLKQRSISEIYAIADWID